MPAGTIQITCSPSVAAIVQLVRDGYGAAAITGLFVAETLQSGEFVELPLKTVPPPIVVSICKPVNASPMIYPAANAAQLRARRIARRGARIWARRFDQDGVTD